MSTVVLVAGRNSYRITDFAEAARLLRVDLVLAGNGTSPLVAPGRTVDVDLSEVDVAARAIARSIPEAAAVVAADDAGVLVAGRAAELLGLRTNPVPALEATRDKLTMRRLLAEAGVTQPAHSEARDGEAARVAAGIGYPVVAKPPGLSAGQGVIRVDGPRDIDRVERRIRRILADAGCGADPLLIEEYVPGDEVSVEALVREGSLEVLAVVDKPDPLVGPYFEETLFVTPSRHEEAVRSAVVGLVGEAVEALGLVTGPVHAEVRVRPDGAPVLIEIAARTIGGLCGRAFTFGLLGESLEVLVLRSALGLPALDTSLALPATGVFMLPIPATGTFTGVEGIEEAKVIPGITDVTFTVPEGGHVVALPEGDRYLGFVFAKGLTPEDVERSLRMAAATLTVTVDGEEVPTLDG